jgi:uncharacterized RDD family membrane protein YckC
VSMDQQGGAQPPQDWQSQPQQPAPTGQPAGSGAPSWTSNITASGTIPGPAGLALADLPNRIIAAVIDFIILGVVGYIVSTISTSVLGDDFIFFGLTGTKIPSLLSSLVAAAVMAAVAVGYFAYMWSRMGGASVGMRVLKLQVRDAGSGGAISQDQAIRRAAFLAAPWGLTWFYGWGIGFIISLIVLAYYVYLLVTAAQSPTRQALHDQQAKTVVAKVA